MSTIKCASIVISCIALLMFSMVFVDWLVLIFIIPFLLFLFVGVVFFHGKELDVEVTRDLSNVKIFEHDKIEVNLRIKNKGDGIQFLEIYDKLPDRVTVSKGSNFSVISLKKNEEVTLKYEITCPIRGQFPLGPLSLRVKDFFGMFYKETFVETDRDITVIPQIEEIRDISLKSKANIYPGIMQTKHSGIGTEFFGIRDYASGDTFKRINWKTFARYNKPMVNEYELESTTDIIIILDARFIQGTGTVKHNPLEYGVKAAVSIASHFLKRRDRVGLIVYGKTEGKLKWIYPESGKKQLYKVIEGLIEAQADGEFPFNGVVYRSVTHMLPKKSSVIYISSLEQDSTIPKGVERLIAYGYNIVILSPSPIDIEYNLQPVDTDYKIAHKILSLERKNFISKLRNLGAKVVDWNPSMPLVVSLKEVEKFQIQR